MTEGKGILAPVPDTRLAVAQFTLCLTCFEWISGSVSSVNTCLGFDSSSIPGFLWNRFVCHPCIWVHVQLLWTHLQQVMNLFHISHCHIFVWRINPSLSLRDFFSGWVSLKAFCISVYFWWQSRMCSLMGKAILESRNVDSLTLKVHHSPTSSQNVWFRNVLLFIKDFQVEKGVWWEVDQWWVCALVCWCVFMCGWAYLR